MSLPEPLPGLVIRYSYLWHAEHVLGREEGQKDRPCAIVAALRSEEGATRALVLPVTHSPSQLPESAIELPARVKERLGLDEQRSWVIISEWNEFVWPGPDLRRAPGGAENSVAYGMLPPRLFAIIRDRFLSVVQSRRGRRVLRTE